jgi:hypothetical protein
MTIPIISWLMAGFIGANEQGSSSPNAWSWPVILLVVTAAHSGSW